MPSFPTLLRNYINRKSKSEAAEFSGKDISERYNLENITECAHIIGELCINEEFDFARVEIKKGSADAEFLCDGKRIQSFKADESDEYEVKNIMPKNRANRLVIKSNNALLYIIELYKWKYAIIN